MAIRPVDYQVLMPKVNETAKIQSELHQKMIGQTQQQADNSSKLAEQEIRSVHSQSEAQKMAITEDEGRDKQRRHSKKDKSKSEDETEGKKQDQRDRQTIDIRI